MPMANDGVTQDGAKTGKGSSFDKEYHDALELVRSHYYQPDKAKSLDQWAHRFDHKLTSAQARDGAISEMVQSLHDPWTQYTSDASMAEHRKLFTDGNRRSAGIWVKMADDGTPEISAVLHGYAGFDSPLRAGDKLVSLNDRPLTGKTADEIENMLQGKVGESLKIQYRTPTDELKTTDVKIAKVYDQEATAKIMQAPDGSKVLYASLPKFDKDAVSAFDDAVDAALKSNGGQKVPIVLDLRGNSGGFIGSARYFESEFLKDGVAYQQVEREGNKQVTYDRYVVPNLADSGSPTDRARVDELQNMPLVVLIDDSSRSAAETVTAGLRDRHRTCAVVGSRSFGKAVVYDDFDTPSGTMQISTSMINSPSGMNWQGKGLVPDIQVDRPREGSPTDVQLAQAIATVESSQCSK